MIETVLEVSLLLSLSSHKSFVVDSLSSSGASLVLANDPDADRLAAAERQPSGEWYVFSGNDIGVLLGVWQWDEWRRTHPDEDASKAVSTT